MPTALRASPNRGFRGSTHTELAEAAMQVLVLVTTTRLSAVDLSQSGRLRPAATGRSEH